MRAAEFGFDAMPPFDLLASGASVQVTLTSAGATTGRLLLPGADMGEDHEEDLT